MLRWTGDRKGRIEEDKLGETNIKTNKEGQIKVTRGRQDWGKKKNKGEGNQMRVPLDRHMGSGRRMEKNKGLK